MPEWLQAVLGHAVVLTVVRIVFLLVVALLARLIIHKVIDRTVEQSIRKPVRLRAAVVLENASGLPAQRRSDSGAGFPG